MAGGSWRGAKMKSVMARGENRKTNEKQNGWRNGESSQRRKGEKAKMKAWRLSAIVKRQRQ
jgi:hypothetical protein